MAEALPHPSASLKPVSKPNLPGSMLELEITPEKVQKKNSKKPAVKSSKKRVVFSEDLNNYLPYEKDVEKGKEVPKSQSHHYPSLENPQLNSTYGVTKQMEKLKLDKKNLEKRCDVAPEFNNIQLVNDRSATALNFKRDEKHFRDLVSVEIDQDRELTKMAPKKVVYEKGKFHQKDEELCDEEIMTFWTDDLLTDNPKLDYNNEIDETSLEPDTSITSLDYLADLYYFEEIVSQFR